MNNNYVLLPGTMFLFISEMSLDDLWLLRVPSTTSNIQCIAGLLDNVILADMLLSRLPLANTDENSPNTTNDESFPLPFLLVLVHREQQKELNKWNSKLQQSLTNDKNYNQQELDDQINLL